MKFPSINQNIFLSQQYSHHMGFTCLQLQMLEGHFILIIQTVTILSKFYSFFYDHEKQHTFKWPFHNSNRHRIQTLISAKSLISWDFFLSPLPPPPPLPLPCILFCWEPPRPRPLDTTSSLTMSMISSGIRRYLMVLPLM